MEENKAIYEVLPPKQITQPKRDQVLRTKYQITENQKDRWTC